MMTYWYNPDLYFPRLGSATLRTITDFLSGEELQPEVDPYAVQERYNKKRDRVRSSADDIGFDGEIRPQEVHEVDEFEGYDLATLRAKVDQIDSTAVADLVADWKNISDKNDESLEGFTGSMSRATDEGVWRGAARDAAANAVGNYTAQGQQVSRAAKLTSSKLDELRTGLEPTKELVPHPPEHRSGVQNFGSWISGRGWRNDDVAEYNAKQEALRVLNTVYAPVVQESDTGVPVIPRPTPMASSGADSVGGGASSGVDFGGASSGDGSRSGSQSFSPNTSSTEFGDPADSRDTQVANNPAGNSPSAGPDSAFTAPASTASATTAPGATTPGGPASGASNSSGSSTGVGGPGNSGEPGGSGSRSGGGGAGRSGVGGLGNRGGIGGSERLPGSASPGNSVRSPAVPVPGAPAGATPPAARSGTSSARSGMTGMPAGLASGGRGGTSDEESGKSAPDYLVTQEHGDELLGLRDLPKTVPPVIGE